MQLLSPILLTTAACVTIILLLSVNTVGGGPYSDLGDTRFYDDDRRCGGSVDDGVYNATMWVFLFKQQGYDGYMYI